VYGDIYPVWSYSSFALLIPVFLLTDLVRYKPMIIYEGLCYVVTWILLLWAEGVMAMQIMQFVYGMATSTEIAYYTYIYAKVPKEDYLKVSSFTRMALLLGKFITGSLSQILDSFDLMDYRELNYISLSSVSFAFIISFFLPAVKNSVYFYKKSKENLESAVVQQNGESVQEVCTSLTVDTFKPFRN
jgi:thiamine transporter 2/3